MPYPHQLPAKIGLPVLLTLVTLKKVCTTLLPYVYPFNQQHSSYMHVHASASRVKNAVDSNQMALSEASSVFFLKKMINLGSA